MTPRQLPPELPVKPAAPGTLPTANIDRANWHCAWPGTSNSSYATAAHDCTENYTSDYGTANNASGSSCSCSHEAVN